MPRVSKLAEQKNTTTHPPSPLDVAQGTYIIAEILMIHLLNFNKTITEWQTDTQSILSWIKNTLIISWNTDLIILQSSHLLCCL